GESGPVTPDRFVWAGVTVEGLPILQWRLLEVLWGAGPPWPAVPLAEAIRRLYGEDARVHTHAEALRKLRNRTAEALETRGAGLVIDRTHAPLRLQTIPGR